MEYALRLAASHLLRQLSTALEQYLLDLGGSAWYHNPVC